MPALGVFVLLFVWWAIVEGFQVKPFIAPSPFLVLDTLYAKRAVLLDNMIPTALIKRVHFPRYPRMMNPLKIVLISGIPDPQA